MTKNKNIRSNFAASQAQSRKPLKIKDAIHFVLTCKMNSVCTCFFFHLIIGINNFPAENCRYWYSLHIKAHFMSLQLDENMAAQSLNTRSWQHPWPRSLKSNCGSRKIRKWRCREDKHYSFHPRHRSKRLSRRWKQTILYVVLGSWPTLE